MKKFFLPLLLIPVLFVTSCDELTSFLEENNPKDSKDQVVRGLKTALEVGSDTAIAVTSRENGFYQDQAIKIFLPPEADLIYQHKDDLLFQTLGLDQLIENTILSMNRAAEDASSEALPILKDAITALSISEGLEILNGSNPAATDKQQEDFDSTAATHYLMSTTYNQLFQAFKPKISTSLDKKLVGNLSSKGLWNNLTASYNSVAEPLGMETVETELDTYVTEKALDGLFLKVGNEERQIRRDPYHWAGTAAGDILTKVFASN
jgi:hypothetical protein